MNFKIILFSFILFSSLILYSFFENDEKTDFFDGTNGNGYSKNWIEIYGSGQEIIIDPEIINTNWTVSPDFPIGLRLFSNDWEITGLKIDSFGDITCTISSNTNIFCWDLNDREISYWIDGPTINEFEENIYSSLSVGGSHVCGIYQSIEGNSLVCNGSNSHGQIGSTDIYLKEHTHIINDPSGHNWSSISTGSEHTCGFNSNNSLYCWGGGILGQIGDGHYTNRYTPVEITQDFDIGTLIEIDSGSYHTCALNNEGEVYCWGWNGYGQIGDGSFKNINMPVKIDFRESKVKSIHLGETHSCALLFNSSLYCWGNNVDGQIKYSQNDDYGTPIFVETNSKGTIIPLIGSKHSCNITEHNWSYQCGNKSINLNGFKEGMMGHSSGDGYDCLIDSEGTVLCYNNTIMQQISEVPVELDMMHVPSTIPAGRIAGIPRNDFSSSHIISSGLKNTIHSEFFVLVNFGEDEDNDGWRNADEIECGTNFRIFESRPLDTDSICDLIDWDDDGDGYSDYNDVFPQNKYEWLDDDNDGIGKNSDSYEITCSVIGAILTSIIMGFLLIFELFSIRKKS